MSSRVALLVVVVLVLGCGKAVEREERPGDPSEARDVRGAVNGYALYMVARDVARRRS